ncbi:hypothetical protein Q5P01_018698 [Channa striata]|uniref:Ig-like domain-containing protein n=1 Tax=Channa striata TaxID=64152 RepID=A0AA88SA55_CHASR|nr:hypothetical protein Q5P01_018698 [Channa striata]
MKMLIALSVILLGLHGAAAVTHSLKYFYTGSSGIPNFPEFVNLGMVDGEQMDYYDSNIKKVIPKQDWMAKTQGPEYWERNTQISIGSEQSFKANIDIVKQRFNQTGGTHILQTMYGCEWDNETKEVNGKYQFGYDGEDFISFNLQTETWIAPVPQAFLSKNKLDKAHSASLKNYLTQLCPEWVNKYVNYGKDSLLRTVRPSVSLLQTSPSSPVSCHATGFYPDRATMFWRKDGDELQENVDHGEILPNQDGTFQITMNLHVSSVKPEDWTRYDCVFQLYGLENDITTKLDKAVIRTNENSMGLVIAIVAGVVLVVLIAVIGFVIYRKKNAKRPPSPVSSTDVMEQLNPTN